MSFFSFRFQLPYHKSNDFNVFETLCNTKRGENIIEILKRGVIIQLYLNKIMKFISEF